MALVAHGWLAHDPDHPGVVEGVAIGAQWSTRREEYSFVRSQAVGNTLCDVATGFNPQIHLFGLIMARSGWATVASDFHPKVVDLPAHPHVRYHLADATDLPYADDLFDTWTCISALEHIHPLVQAAIVKEAFRVVKPGGRLVATADGYPTLPRVFGFDVEPGPVPELELNPPVYYVVVDKEI